jgi:cobalt-zinc-cadmium efflux system protein
VSGERRSERRRLVLVMAITAVTMIAEFVGGFLTHSIALLGDAAHMLTHLIALGISYFAILIALRPAPPEKTYRNWRAEILGSLYSGIALILLAIYVMYEAYHRYRNPEEIRAVGMLAVAFIGLVVNIICAVILHHHAKDDINIRGAFLHMLADTASSVGVMVAGVVLLIREEAKWVDPLVAALISVLILVWAARQIRQATAILLEAAPRHIKLDDLTGAMKGVEGVRDIHDLHLWTITSRMHALTAHVLLERDIPISEAEEIGRKLSALVDEKFGINHAVFQYELTPGAQKECDEEHGPSPGHSH